MPIVVLNANPLIPACQHFVSRYTFSFCTEIIKETLLICLLFMLYMFTCMYYEERIPVEQWELVAQCFLSVGCQAPINNDRQQDWFKSTCSLLGFLWVLEMKYTESVWLLLLSLDVLLTTSLFYSRKPNQLNKKHPQNKTNNKKNKQTNKQKLPQKPNRTAAL